MITGMYRLYLTRAGTGISADSGRSREGLKANPASWLDLDKNQHRGRQACPRG